MSEFTYVRATLLLILLLYNSNLCWCYNIVTELAKSIIFVQKQRKSTQRTFEWPSKSPSNLRGQRPSLFTHQTCEAKFLFFIERARRVNLNERVQFRFEPSSQNINLLNHRVWNRIILTPFIIARTRFVFILPHSFITSSNTAALRSECGETSPAGLVNLWSHRSAVSFLCIRRKKYRVEFKLQNNKHHAHNLYILSALFLNIGIIFKSGQHFQN